MNGITTDLIRSEHQLTEKAAAEILKPFQQVIEDYQILIKQAKEIQVKDEFDTSGMQQAREMRLKLRKVRTAADKIKTDEKAQYLKMGNAIQYIFNTIKDVCSEEEARQLAMEETAKRLELERIAKLDSERRELIQPYAEYCPINSDFGNMSQSEFDLLLKGAKLTAKEAEEAKRLEAERVARHNSRQAQIQPYLYLVDEMLPYLGDVTEETFQDILSRAKAKHEKHLDELAEKKRKDEELARMDEAVKAKTITWAGVEPKGINIHTSHPSERVKKEIADSSNRPNEILSETPHFQFGQRVKFEDEANDLVFLNYDSGKAVFVSEEMFMQIQFIYKNIQP